MKVRILQGDVLKRLADLEDESVQCVVTSPPYWGLRDYGVDGQLGLENSPAEHVAAMVEVFRDVRRVLRSDGVLWLNYGDGYIGDPGGHQGDGQRQGRTFTARIKHKKRGGGLKPKQLVGMPWLVAKALQAPYYTGDITREKDRVWLAAIIDGEGTICGFKHKRKDDGRTRTGASVFVTNCNRPLLDKCQEIWPASRHEHQKPRENRFSDKDCWRWIVSGSERKSALLAELYPYLIAKKTQALVAWNLLQFVRDGKRLGRGEHGPEIREKRALLTSILSKLNHDEEVVLPSWLKPIPEMYEPGWWLRSDVIWHKPNAHPESILDRPHKSHEYVFLLSKSRRYFYDADSVRTPLKVTTWDRRPRGAGKKGGDPEMVASAGWAARRPHRIADQRGANLRTVWTIATQPFDGEHFATFPPKLAERCILAGSKQGDTILDPFGGAATVGLVAERTGRHAILIEINPEYVEMGAKRVREDSPLLVEVSVE